MFKKSLSFSKKILINNYSFLKPKLFKDLQINQKLYFSDKKQDQEEKNKQNEKDQQIKKEQYKQQKEDKQDKKNNKKEEQQSQQEKIDEYAEYLKGIQEYLKEEFQFKKLKKKIKIKYNEFNNQQKLVLFIAISIIGYQIYYQFYFDNEISFNDYLYNYLTTDQIEQITIFKYNNNQKLNEAYIKLKSGDLKIVKIGNLDYFLQKTEEIQMENYKNNKILVPIQFGNFINFQYYYNRLWNSALLLLQIVTLAALITIRNKSMGMTGNMLNNELKEKIFEMQKNLNIRFKDVAGQQESKQEIMEFVEFLKEPKKYQDIGARMPRGALLSGPPGTGKTLLAKACAGEAGVPFFYLSGSEFVEMFVGVGASRVRELFKKAKENSPSIIFIDEIDAIGKKRDGKVNNNDEKDNTLNQLLVEMDGFSTKEYVVIMGATNRPELLDKALTRPGRFDRNIEVTLPDLQARKDIFLVHLKPLKLSSQFTMEEYANRLATLTPGFSGAEIANLCNEAAILAGRNGHQTVESIDFEMASERIIAGLEKKGNLDLEQRKKVAIHESGHAICGWFLEGCSPLIKLTIIPRSKGSLGFAQYLPKESNLQLKQQLLDQIVFILGGRCAEELFYNETSTGASDDIQRAYEIAYNMVTKFGMDEDIGYRHFEDGSAVKHYSLSTQKLVDQAIERIINQAQIRAQEMVIQHKQHILNLSNALLQKNTLDLNQIVQIIGPRPFKVTKDLLQYLKVKEEIKQSQQQQQK